MYMYLYFYILSERRTFCMYLKLLNYPSYFKYKSIHVYYETRALKHEEGMLSTLDKVSSYVIIAQLHNVRNY